MLLRTQKRPVKPVKLVRRSENTIVRGQTVTLPLPVTALKRPVTLHRTRQATRVTGRKITVTGTRRSVKPLKQGVKRTYM